MVVLFLASCSLGGAWQSVDATSEYLKDRVAFGEPLANFQVIGLFLPHLYTSPRHVHVRVHVHVHVGIYILLCQDTVQIGCKSSNILCVCVFLHQLSCYY